MMLTHCGNNVRNRYSGCVFSVKDIVPVPLKTSRNRYLSSYISCIVPSILYGLTCSAKPPEADLGDEVFVGMSRGQENLIEELVAKVLLIREELEKLGFCTGWAEIE